MPESGAPATELLNAVDSDAWIAAARAGDFATAWACSDRIRARAPRLNNPATPRHLQLIWDGSPLHRQRVLVRCYHGLGDTIQFVRYFQPLSRIARRLAVWLQPALLPLLTHSYPEVTFTPLHDGVPDVDYDVDVEIMELAYVFRTTLATIPADVPYLRVPAVSPPVNIAGAASADLRVGLVWRAGDWDARRSVPFPALLPLLALADVRWFSLQQQPRRDEHHPALDVVELSTAIATVTATAAAMLELDLVISVDTMTAHLAGAIGVPVWLLLPEPADWRWLSGCWHSPWYPTMRLFRQAEAGRWEPVIAEVVAALTAAALARRRAGRETTTTGLASPASTP